MVNFAIFCTLLKSINTLVEYLLLITEEISLREIKDLFV